MTIRRLHLLTIVAIVALVVGIGPTASASRPAFMACDLGGSAATVPDPRAHPDFHFQTIAITGALENCVGGGVRSAVLNAGLSGPLGSCNGGYTGALRLLWSSGERSQVSVTLTPWATNPTAFSISGTVLDGRFAGQPVTGSMRSLEQRADCPTDTMAAGRVEGTLVVHHYHAPVGSPTT